MIVFEILAYVVLYGSLGGLVFLFVIDPLAARNRARRSRRAGRKKSTSRRTRQLLETTRRI